MFKPIDTCLRGICKSTAAHSLVLFEHLIRFSCVAKHRISIGKKSNLLHSNDRWLKDINRKKNQGKTIDRVHLFQENLMVAKIDLTLSTTLLIASPESDFSIQNLRSKTATVVGFVVVSSQIGQSHPLVWLIEVEWM